MSGMVRSISKSGCDSTYGGCDSIHSGCNHPHSSCNSPHRDYNIQRASFRAYRDRTWKKAKPFLQHPWHAYKNTIPFTSKNRGPLTSRRSRAYLAIIVHAHLGKWETSELFEFEIIDKFGTLKIGFKFI